MIPLLEQLKSLCEQVIVLMTVLISLYTPQFGGMGGIESPLDLKVAKEDILNNKEVDDIRCDKETHTCQNYGKMVKYLYISDKEVLSATLDGTSEDISKRTHNSQFFQNGDTKTARIYTGTPFYEKNGKWYQTETATTTVEAFADQTRLSFYEKIIGQVFAASPETYASGAGDGETGGVHNTWATIHDATDVTGFTGAYANYTADTTTGVAGYMIGSTQFYGAGSDYTIARAFLPFDTSGLPEGITITTATVDLYITAKTDTAGGANGYMVISGQTNQASTAEIVMDDFDQAGATAGSATLDVTDITTGAYNTFTLNATGRGWISTTGTTKIGVRDGFDITNTPVADPNVEKGNGINFRTSEYTGIGSDPSITITYTGGEAPVIQSEQNLIIFE